MCRFPIVVVAAAVSVIASISAPMRGLSQTQTPSDKKSGQAQAEYVFRTSVRRVPLDVVVLDKSGNPVRGLTRNDFVVEEDRKPQNVLSFEFFDGSCSDFRASKGFHLCHRTRMSTCLQRQSEDRFTSSTTTW